MDRGVTHTSMTHFVGDDCPGGHRDEQVGEPPESGAVLAAAAARVEALYTPCVSCGAWNATHLDGCLASDLGSIEARANAATPGPWSSAVGTVEGIWSHASVFGPDGDQIVETWGSLAEGTSAESDAALIAHSRTDIPYLLDRIATLEGDRERLRSALRPFADFDMESTSRRPDTAEIYEFRGDGHAVMTWGDVRRAALVLRETERGVG